MDPAWVGAALVGQLRRGRADVPAPAAPAVHGPSGPSPGPGRRRSRVGTWSCSPSRAERNRLVPNRAVEDPLGASPMARTFIRATSLLQNRSITHAPRSVSATSSGCGRQGPHRLRGRPRRRRPRPQRPQPRGHGLHPDRPGRAHRRRTAAHWPHAWDLGNFTRDHASSGRRPPWPLPERLALSTQAHRQGSGLRRAVLGVARPRTGPEVAFKQGAIRPCHRPGLPRQLAWNWLRKEWP
jgi:hypothetical protein